MKNILSFVFLFSFLHASISAARDPFVSGPKKNKDADTSSYKFDSTAAKASLTYSDSVCMIPAYEIYRQWDTTVIHPYHFEASCFKDTVTLILTGINSSAFVTPRVGRTNSNYGPRHRRAHFGVDIHLETGDSVLSAFDGKVRIAKLNKSYGNVVIIRHDNGLETIYAHLSKILVQADQCVKAGELVGLGGNTGHSYGSHLHFEVRYKGEPINPNEIISFVDQRLVSDTAEITQQSFELYMNCKNGKYIIKKGKKYSKSVSAKAARGYYYVRKGDTLYSIARKYGTTPAKLCQLNKIKTTTILRVGTKIKCG
jgi:LysM repeat protein